MKQRNSDVAPSILEMILGFEALTGLGLARTDSSMSSARLGGWLEFEARSYKGMGLTGTANMSCVQSLLVRGRNQLHERYRQLEPSELQLADSEPQDFEPANRERNEPKAGHVP